MRCSNCFDTLILENIHECSPNTLGVMTDKTFSNKCAYFLKILIANLFWIPA